LDTTSIIILTIAGLVVASWWAIKRETEKIWAIMRKLNARHGTAFGTTLADIDTVIGMNTSGIMAFDRKNRKIAYITKNGKTAEVLDYSFIRSWQLTWDERTYASGGQIGFAAFGSSRTKRFNAMLVIATSDLRRPIIKLPMLTVAAGENANARLSILINGKA
jgi:hypothetical protein